VNKPAAGSGRPVSRREARERAIELAYEADLRDISVDELIAGQTLQPDDFVVELLRVTEARRDEADELIASRSAGWSIERMPAIDRLVMRQAVSEMLAHDTPTGVILAEAVELASRYSTDESSRFVNGVLAAVAREVRSES
jgi:N utilization substance protein B